MSEGGTHCCLCSTADSWKMLGLNLSQSKDTLMAGRGHSPMISSPWFLLSRTRLHMRPRKDTEGTKITHDLHSDLKKKKVCGLTEEAEQLEPAGLLLAAEAALVPRQVSEVVQLEQVDDADVDELLRAEGFLQDQPLHTQSKC